MIERFTDQIWYNRQQGLKQRLAKKEMTFDPEIWKCTLKAAKRIEEKYGKEILWYESDFEWGMLNGKLFGLRWLVREEWDMLDT